MRGWVFGRWFAGYIGLDQSPSEPGVACFLMTPARRQLLAQGSRERRHPTAFRVKLMHRQGHVMRIDWVSVPLELCSSDGKGARKIEPRPD